MNKIRNLGLADIEKCIDLFIAVFNAEPWNDNWTQESAYHRLHDIFISPHFVGLVYEDNDKLLGAVFGNIEQWYEGMHYNLREIFVSNEAQGKGIGQMLLAKLEGIIKESDVRTVILYTSREDKTSGFYKKNGYIDLDDMVMMGKEI